MSRLLSNPLSLLEIAGLYLVLLNLDYYFQAHLHRFGLEEDDTCPLCHDGTTTIRNHIFTYPELDNQLYKSVVTGKLDEEGHIGKCK